ncbi:MAG: hypothetical protein A2W91_01025 [Bacteroidetes bacterium GWF2_38_335]|nr:MAG: hypothetical protein A2W91_01025 [Bacteroidetes bacterium GWF2_38_335]OFY80336.1 MAG: hypothetical protein A2281_17535 [Bacteroidetes bacterium RIFOXYA12_FULL_38_20]HBS88863.1 hypothetical protein [Bacteroidales bacterium]
MGFISQNKMKNLHYMVKSNSDSIYFNDLKFNDIPRFVLIDKKGEIYNPSFEGVYEGIEKLLKMK